MAQMSVPAEPSYKTTSYNGLKGADFSNDPSLVARNHSPDLLNMISDNGGSPIKRKGWEVTDKSVLGESFTHIWHFQMYGKTWHVGALYKAGIGTTIVKIDDDGEYSNLLITPTDVTDVYGTFFQSADDSKTGFYVFYSSASYPNECGTRIIPQAPDYTTLVRVNFEPTIPVVRELTNYKGNGGVSYPVNLLTRKMTFKFLDKREASLSPRNYYCFPETSSVHVADILSVRVLNSNGEWKVLSNAEYRIQSQDNKKVNIDTVAPKIPDPDATENNVEITIVASGAAGTDKIGGCTCSTVFSQMTSGQLFVSGNPDYPQYVWYSELDDPTYFPDINYLFVGGAGTKVKGMIPFNSQIAVFKEPSVTESTIFMINYTTATDQKVATDGTTSTETRDVDQVKHGFTGVGCLTANSVFSLGDEPLFLSQHGIMGMVSNAINSANAVKSRSDFLNPRLIEEDDLSNAVATVHKNYYILVVNGHAYILDMRQKSSDYKGNTSYLYESYYWDNIPASCISSDGETLWFGTADGRICRFKNTGQMDDYSDGTHYGDEPIRVYVKHGETALSSTWFVNSGNEAITPDEDEKYMIMGEVYVNEQGEIVTDPEYDDGTYTKGAVFSYSESAYVYEYTADPIHAVWSTPLDNDGATNYLKTLQKKGSGCTLYPFTRSSVDAYLVKDLNGEVYIGSALIDVANWDEIDFERFTFIASKAPRDMFFRKKMKKYKRLKIVLKNEALDEGFGVQEIFKTYLFTRYAK